LDNSKVVGGDEDVTLSIKGVPGTAFTVFAHSATFPDGSHVGRLSISQVHSDKLPMVAPRGTAPSLMWTVQPPRVQFNPPIRVQIPNTNALPAGTVTETFCYSHDLEQFVSGGTARVSEDGSVIVSDRGFGLVVSGWGGSPPPAPPTSCGSGCGPCKSCIRNTCVANPFAFHTPCGNGNECPTKSCNLVGQCTDDSNNLSKVSGACVVPTAGSATYTSDSSSASRLKWNAPGGNPNSAQGASITPTYAAEGAKVVTAICGSKSATKNVTVAISCANVNPPNLNAEQVNQAPDANPVGAVIFGQVHFDQSHSAKYKGCAENFKWCFRLEEFKEKHGVGIRSNGRIDITGANDPNVD